MKQEDIQKVISLRQMFPIFFGSALKDEGVEEFMEALDLYTCQKEALDILSGIVFKKTFHKQKHLTHLKVTGGTLHVKDVISESKVDELRIYTGQGYQSVQSASTGDIVKLSFDAGQAFQIVSDYAYNIAQEIDEYKDSQRLVVNNYTVVMDIANIDSTEKEEIPTDVKEGEVLPGLSESIDEANGVNSSSAASSQETAE